MPFDQAPRNPITADEAVSAVRDYIAQRASAGVMMAEAFTDVELSNGVLTASWSEQALGKDKSATLLSVNPFDDLSIFIGTPLAFDNEQGRQIRQHVHTVSVIGPFGVGSKSTRELYERATGLSG